MTRVQRDDSDLTIPEGSDKVDGLAKVTQSQFHDPTADDEVERGANLDSVVWSDSPEEEYLEQILKEQQVNSEKIDTVDNENKDTASTAGDKSNPTNGQLKKTEGRNVDKDYYDDDDDQLPGAIKMMDVISVEEKPAPVAARQKPRTLENIIQPPKKTSTLPTLTSSAPSPEYVDPAAYDQVSLTGDYTVDGLIHDLEREEEERLYGMFASDDNSSPGSSTNCDGQGARRTGTLLRTMNPSYDEQSTNSMIGQGTVDGIINGMESDDIVDDVEEGTLRSWEHFRPIAGSVATREDATTTSALIREATADMIATSGNPTIARKLFFVDDQTSVGSWTDDLEVVVKKRRADSDRDHYGVSADDETVNVTNTLVSSLSDTYLNNHSLGQNPMPASDSEGAPWWVRAESIPFAVNNASPESSKDAPPSPASSIQSLPTPMTPSTYNSETDAEYDNEVKALPPTRNKSKRLEKKTRHCARPCHFLIQAIHNNACIRYLLIFSAIFFLVVSALLVLFLFWPWSKANVQDTAVSNGSDDSSTSHNMTTPPPFDVEGLNNQTFIPWEPNQSQGQNGATLDPVIIPSAAAFNEYKQILQETLSNRLPESLQGLEDPSSPQYQALEWMASTEPENQITSNHEKIIQRWVLAVLYFSTSGEEWIDSSGWLTSENECNWFYTLTEGICNSEGLIEQLDLRWNNLSGRVPSELLLLSSSLVSFRLQGNSLTGSIPSFVTELTNLQRLNLSENILTGMVSSELGSLSALTSLALGQNQLSGTLPFTLARLANLEYLGMGNNSFVGTIPRQYGKLLSLVELELHDTGITGTVPLEIGFLSNLVQLDLMQTQLSGTIPTELCTMLDAPDMLAIRVDCEDVSCSCCEGC